LLVLPLRVTHGEQNRSDKAAEPKLVRLGLHGGTSRVVRLEGVGCDETICSRIAVNNRTVGNVIVNRTRFEDIRAIQDIGGETATFMFRNGTTRRVSVIPDNRVLYVIEKDGGRRKIGLNTVRSIDLRPDGVQ
jgi:hypothetical protein